MRRISAQLETLGPARFVLLIGLVAGAIQGGLVMADMLTAALAMVVASIDTHGAFAASIAGQPLTVILSNLTIILLRSPLWFVGSALAIALGRHLSVGERPLSASTSPVTHP